MKESIQLTYSFCFLVCLLDRGHIRKVVGFITKEENMKIMFVCHGNICRSPMAEFVFKRMCREGNVRDVEIFSSATSNEEIWNGLGNPVYPPAREELKKHGIDCGDKRAVQLKKDDYDRYDLFIAMDDNNVRNMQRIFGTDPNCKICKLMDYVGGGEVADPWYTGGFERAYLDIERGCQALFEEIVKGL